MFSVMITILITPGLLITITQTAIHHAVIPVAEVQTPVVPLAVEVLL
jgi:hypothetical protein